MAYGESNGHVRNGRWRHVTTKGQGHNHDTLMTQYLETAGDAISNSRYY